MRHARPDYQDRFQDAAGIIPEDEPVFLLRGQDICAPVALDAYAAGVEIMGGDPAISSAAYCWAAEMREWQGLHKSKMPDMPPADPGACDGCGSIETVDQIRARDPAALSCCPERKMLSAAEWMARATSAEAALRPVRVEDWPKVVDELVMIFVVHPSYAYAAPADRDEWAAWYEATWVTHNGGGWVWNGMTGKVLAVRPMPPLLDHREIMDALS